MFNSRMLNQLEVAPKQGGELLERMTSDIESAALRRPIGSKS